MGSWYIAGRESQRDEGLLYSYMNNAEGFRQNSEIDLETILAAAKDFPANGGNRLAGVEWIEWPPDQV
jgi:Immunity protein Imm1